MYYVTTHRGVHRGVAVVISKKGIRTTMRAFKASCNIISAAIGARRAAVAAALAHVSPARPCITCVNGGGGGLAVPATARACLLACLDASISCRIPLES